MFYREFLRNYWEYYCKTPSATASECWRLGNILVIAGRRYHYSVLCGFPFWVIAFHGPSHAMKEFISKLFIKALRNSVKFSEIYALWSIWYCYLHKLFPCFFLHHFSHGGINGRSLSIDHFPPTWNLESMCNNFIWSFALIGLFTIYSAMFICLFYHSP